MTPEAEGGSTYGRKRSYRYAYRRPADATGLPPPITEGVKLELVRMGSPAPNYPHTINSYIAEYALATSTLQLEEFAELDGVAIAVLGAERTLVDKLCLLHDLAVRIEEADGDIRRGFANQARHYYGVCQLLAQPSVLQCIQAVSGGVAMMAAQTVDESAAARRPMVGARPTSGFADSPAFQPSGRASDLARTAYDEEVPRLIYSSQLPSFDDVVAMVQRQAAFCEPETAPLVLPPTSRVRRANRSR